MSAGTTITVHPADLPHLLNALDLAEAMAVFWIGAHLSTDADRELGELRRAAYRRIRDAAEAMS